MAITVRIPTAQYAYVEVTDESADQVKQQLDTAQHLISLLGGVVYPNAVETAVGNLKDGGLISEEPPGLAPQQTDPRLPQAGVQWTKNKFGDEIAVLGTDPVSKQQIEYNPKGKYGPVVKADVFGSLGKSWDPSRIPSLDEAISALQYKRNKG